MSCPTSAFGVLRVQGLLDRLLVALGLRKLPNGCGICRVSVLILFRISGIIRIRKPLLWTELPIVNPQSNLQLLNSFHKRAVVLLWSAAQPTAETARMSVRIQPARLGLGFVD